MNAKEPNDSVHLLDILIFSGLESLGFLAIVGNASLICVLLRGKYLSRASFILMLNLAIADVIHGVVTTCYFYPPIILKRTHVGELAIRIFNIVDWTAWAITLTHMSAICLDRLVAIMFFDRYNVIVTITRIRNYSIMCWVVFLAANIALFSLDQCCMIRPLKSQHYYSFGYLEKDVLNIYVVAYTPLEIATIVILSISNPTTLVQLYRRHKRKLALKQQGLPRNSETSSIILKQHRSHWQRASTMLVEMSMKIGSKYLVASHARAVAARKASRQQQQKILLQISVVAFIFYGYMTAYYVSYYSRYFQSKAAMVFNSFFYSTTHMINPVIYFTLNSEMRAQLKSAISSLTGCCSVRKKDAFGFAGGSTRFASHTDATAKRSNTSYDEASPFCMVNRHYRSICKESTSRKSDIDTVSYHKDLLTSTEDRLDSNSIGTDKVLGDDEYSSVNKMTIKERSEFMNKLEKILRRSSSSSLTDSPRAFVARRSSDTVSKRTKSMSVPDCDSASCIAHINRAQYSFSSSSSVSDSCSSGVTTGILSSDSLALLLMPLSDDNDDEIAYL
ncbi:hypothetical protein Q1695_000070 [Nippostrongylus brasiliensis]|nr:hypothetical protein Q1695_000070 [Nippostrongylus brasiliensis]